VMFTIVILKKIPLHPMHYLFISAGFFAFHILLAYLVDKIDIHYAFWICAAVSAVLVVNYMRMVAGAKFAVVSVGLAQLVYLVGFSYAFFWIGWTGLTIVVVAIITLGVLMVATAKVVWDEVFKKPPAAPAAPRVPPRASPDQTGG
jgi:inner membrane protein involved in colicin E2 resistance